MKKKLTQEELRQMVVNSVRENGMNEVFNDEHINEIVRGIISDYKISKEKADIPSEISESPTFTGAALPPIVSASSSLPSEEDVLGSKGVEQNPIDIGMEIGKEAGAEPTEQPSDPKMYRPELPLELQGKEPAEFIVWDYNDLSVGGENLSNKPFGTLEDPETKATMIEKWKEEGKSTAKVYVAKFEELGEIHFDYVSGQSHFIEKGKGQGVNASVNTYHENPYAAQDQAQVEKINTETDLAKTLESSVDIQSTLEKVLKDLVMKGLDRSIGSEEEAISLNPPVNVTMPTVNKEVEDEEDVYEIVGINEVVSPYGNFKQTKTPEDLVSCLKEGKESKEIGYSERIEKGVREYCKEGVCYYMPEKPLSFSKSYIVK